MEIPIKKDLTVTKAVIAITATPTEVKEPEGTNPLEGKETVSEAENNAANKRGLSHPRTSYQLGFDDGAQWQSQQTATAIEEKDKRIQQLEAMVKDLEAENMKLKTPIQKVIREQFEEHKHLLRPDFNEDAIELFGIYICNI